MDVEWGGVNVERLPLSRQDGEHCAHHQQSVPATNTQNSLKEQFTRKVKATISPVTGLLRRNVLQEHDAS